MPKVIIDGVEYAPLVDFKPPTDEKMLAALRELTAIQYFAECSHKHRAWAWDALNALNPELAELAANNPQAAFDRVRPNIDTDEQPGEKL